VGAAAVSVDIRAEMHAVMVETLLDEAAHHGWDYVARRPCYMPTAHRAYVPGARVVGDCSKGCQFVSWWSPPAPDPMGLGFGPSGNSQTLWLHCTHLAHPSELKVGDFATMGFDGSEHAVCILEAGSDPVCWSFGHQGAPNKYPLSYDRRPQQWLRNPLPDLPLTPEDRLRARTDWFSWMKWIQGEGEWKRYGARNPKVRPNVPKVIGSTAATRNWWLRRARFLAARNHGDKPTTAKLVA
jgi:hypothetical protein